MTTMAFIFSPIRCPSKQRTSTSAAPVLCPVYMSNTSPTVSRRAVLLSIPLLSASILPLPSLADHTYVAARRSYERYYPRIVSGVEQMREIRDKIMRDGSIDEIVQDKIFDVKLRRALSIYATSFSDNYIGERTKDMLRSIDAFYGEVGKAREGGERVEHYNLAVDALEKYFEVARLDGKVLQGLQI